MSKSFSANLEQSTLIVTMQANPTNTLTNAAFREMIELLNEAKSDSKVRSVILRSNQPGYFSNGLDPDNYLNRTREEIHEGIDLLARCANEIFFFYKPVIALINGHCMGAGSVFALFSDYRYMVDGAARIGFPEVKIGINYPFAAAVYTQRMLGIRQARDLLYTGKALKPPEALEIGLVDELHPVEDLDEKGLKLASQLNKLAPEGINGIKTDFRKEYEDMFLEKLAWDISFTVDTIASPNVQEGFLALKEKRRPKFQL